MLLLLNEEFSFFFLNDKQSQIELNWNKVSVENKCIKAQNISVRLYLLFLFHGCSFEIQFSRTIKDNYSLSVCFVSSSCTFKWWLHLHMEERKWDKSERKVGSVLIVLEWNAKGEKKRFFCVHSISSVRARKGSCTSPWTVNGLKCVLSIYARFYS